MTKDELDDLETAARSPFPYVGSVIGKTCMEARDLERERCARLVEAFPDSLWRHSFRKKLAALIRSGR